MIFADNAIFQGRTNPDRLAMIWNDRIVTYGMLADSIDWVTRRLHAAGVKAGETIAITLDNPIRDAVVTLSLMRLGAVSATLRPDQLPDLPRNGAAAIVTHQSGAAVHGVRRVVMDDQWFSPTDLPHPGIEDAYSDPDRICRVSMTSGTTGHAKIFASTFAETQTRIRNIAACHWCPGSSRVLLLVGSSIMWGFNETMRGLSASSTVCFAGSGEDALRTIDMFQVDSIFAAPQQIRALMDAMDGAPGTCESVKFVGMAGSLITPAFADEIQRRVARTVAVSYGSTEAGKTVAAPFHRLRDVQGAVGYILPGKRLEIVDEQDTPVPAGVQGQVRIMAPAGGHPYQPGNLYPDRKPAWFYPGDLGVLREDGLLVITGRIDEVLNAGGNKVAPDIIEQLVVQRYDILDAAAFGVDGSAGLPEIWLAVVAKGAVDDSELIAWCEQRLPDTPINRIVRVDVIPRNGMGKVERTVLKASVSK